MAERKLPRAKWISARTLNPSDVISDMSSRVERSWSVFRLLVFLGLTAKSGWKKGFEIVDFKNNEAPML